MAPIRTLPRPLLTASEAVFSPALSPGGALVLQAGLRTLSGQGSTVAEGATYDSHVPLSPGQRAAVAVGSALGALMNPARADLVAALGETTGTLALRRIWQQMRQDPVGQMILAERPRVVEETLKEAEACPPLSFGAAYADFMHARHFSPDERPTVRFVADPTLSYIAQRSREVHDFWHVLFGLKTNVSGELTLKMIELIQTGLPMCALSVIGGPLRLSSPRRRQLALQLYPWAVTAGLNAPPLMCVYYEKHFQDPIASLRIDLCIQPRPHPT